MTNTLTVGETFDGWINQLKASIENDRTFQVHHLLVSLKGSYNDKLKMAFEKVDKSTKEVMDKVPALLNSMDQPNLLEDIVNASPLKNEWVPFIKEMTPSFIAVAKDTAEATQVSLTFKGQFKKCITTLTLKDKIYKPVESSKTQLKFLVDISGNTPELQMDKMSTIAAKVQISWKSGYFYSTSSEYDILLRLLPASPGAIRICYSKLEDTQRRILKSTNQIFNKDNGPQVAVLNASNDWHIVPNTSLVLWTKKEGTLRTHLAVDDQDQLIYQVEGDGNGEYVISCEEVLKNPKSERVEVLSLTWGESKQLAPNKDEKIKSFILQAFTGEYFRFFNEISHRFITINEKEGAMIIKSKTADEINEADFKLIQAYAVKS